MVYDQCKVEASPWITIFVNSRYDNTFTRMSKLSFAQSMHCLLFCPNFDGIMNKQDINNSNGSRASMESLFANSKQ